MNKIEKLLNELCPNGVEFKSLGEVCEVVRGKGLSKSDVCDGVIPVILYGELYTTYGDYITKIQSFTDASKIQNSPKIIINDLLLPISSTTKDAAIGKVSAYLLDDDCFLGSDAIILRHSQNAGFLVHLLNSSWFNQLKMGCCRGTTINHLIVKEFLALKIPIPPLEIQEEIVKILDIFTELEAELEARRRQYEYYRNKLLSFEYLKTNGGGMS
ncbi:restriction endonuclease subunit S [Campylobacter jejuni]|nr:restriction endonuclease subunit S [Campylobacter jejuni]